MRWTSAPVHSWKDDSDAGAVGNIWWRSSCCIGADLVYSTSEERREPLCNIRDKALTKTIAREEWRCTFQTGPTGRFPFRSSDVRFLLPVAVQLEASARSFDPVATNSSFITTVSCYLLATMQRCRFRYRKEDGVCLCFVSLGRLCNRQGLIILRIISCITVSGYCIMLTAEMTTYINGILRQCGHCQTKM